MVHQHNPHLPQEVHCELLRPDRVLAEPLLARPLPLQPIHMDADVRAGLVVLADVVEDGEVLGRVDGRGGGPQLDPEEPPTVQWTKEWKSRSCGAAGLRATSSLQTEEDNVQWRFL